MKPNNQLTMIHVDIYKRKETMELVQPWFPFRCTAEFGYAKPIYRQRQSR
jgi:hypothetical protein